MVSALARQFAIPARLRTPIKIAVSAGILLFLLARLNPSELLNQLGHAQPLWLLGALGSYYAAIFLGVLKWYVLVRVQRLDVSFWNLANYTFTGLFLGNVLPTNVGGDIVRATMLARGSSGKTEAAASSVFVDRLLGLSALLGVTLVSVILGASLLAHSTELEALQTASIATTLLIAIGSALFFSRRVARRLAVIFEFKPLARFRSNAQSIYHSIQVYRHNFSALAINIALSASILLIATLVWYWVARGLNLNIPILYFFLFNPLIAFVLLLPISFNGLGPKEATAVFFFGLAGVPSESAFVLSLLFHAIVVLASLPGAVFIARSRQ